MSTSDFALPIVAGSLLLVDACIFIKLQKEIEDMKAEIAILKTNTENSGRISMRIDELEERTSERGIKRGKNSKSKSNRKKREKTKKIENGVEEFGW